MEPEKSKRREGWQYCPLCRRWLEAVNIEDVKKGRANSYVFVHDNVIHEPEDVIALAYGIN